MRVGSLIKLRPEWEEWYIILHRHTFPAVLERIHKSNIRNYSIFLHDGILFSYLEYEGEDYDGDMAEISRDGVTRDWWKLTDPMQEPLETRAEGEWWASMDEIFHWSGKTELQEKARRMAFTTRILDSFEDKMIESLKIAYPILVETSDLKDIMSFSIYHKDGSLYSYFEFLDADLGVDIQKLQATLKVEDELEWMPMKEVFHTD
ncbi:MAG: L-rhamnose mutarotase [Candidatus Aminicenantes bacterium]|nr:MAG: L-rhamnose mutarotase [Candidatus Aminicenantes bacterium]